jgi:hypothetical protein
LRDEQAMVTVVPAITAEGITLDSSVQRFCNSMLVLSHNAQSCCACAVACAAVCTLYSTALQCAKRWCTATLQPECSVLLCLRLWLYGYVACVALCAGLCVLQGGAAGLLLRQCSHPAACCHCGSQGHGSRPTR